MLVFGVCPNLFGQLQKIFDSQVITNQITALLPQIFTALFQVFDLAVARVSTV